MVSFTNMRPKNTAALKHYLLLLLVAIAGYWWLFIYAAQYDLLDCWLPWRHFISKSFHNGIFPLWNPYQQLGYPIFADLQGPALSIENFITGNLVHINLTALQCILFSYIFIAAAGMYELCVYLYKNRHSALVIAIAYVTGGIFIYHTQHFFSIVSFACIPATLVVLLKFLNSPQWKYIFALVVLFHIQFTTGNQTFNILNFHFICFFVIQKIWLLWKERNKPDLKILLQKTGILLVIMFIVLLPVFISYWQTSHTIARYEGLSYEKSLVNSMTLTAALSFLNPLISSQPYEFLGTDQGMSNYFFGFILLCCAILHFISPASKHKPALLITLLFLFLISLGDLTPVYKIVYSIDPLLHLFRFPAYYMYYVVLILLVAAGYYLTQVLEEKTRIKNLQLTATILTGILLLGVVKYGFNKGHILYDLKNNNAFNAFKAISIDQTFTLSFLLCLVMTIGVYLLSVFKSHAHTILLTLIILESVISANMLNLQLATGETTKAINSFIAKTPKQFYLTTNKAITNDSLIKQVPLGIWRNYQGYFNAVSPDFFNSFYDKKINEFDSSTNLLKETYQKPFFTSSDSITLNQVLVEPGQIEFETHSKKTCELTIKQITSPYWEIYINKSRIRAANNNLIRFSVPSGSHQIKIVFENQIIKYAAWISWLFVLLSTIMFIFLHFNRITFVFVAGIVISISTASLFLFLENKHHTQITLNKIEIQPENH